MPIPGWSPLPGASWQRCRTHYLRNLLTRVPRSAQPHVATQVRTIFDQADADAVAAQFDRVVAALSEKFGDAAAHLDDARADLLAFTGYPREIWRQIWSNNPQERLNKSTWNGRPRSAVFVGHPRWRAEPLPEEAGRHEQCESFPRSHPSRVGRAQGLDLGGHSAAAGRGRRRGPDQQRPPC